jgi:hypothetical protein
MTIDVGAGLLRGGTISVDGALVIVPENSLVTLPAATVAWPELFDANGKPQFPGTQTWKASVSLTVSNVSRYWLTWSGFCQPSQRQTHSRAGISRSRSRKASPRIHYVYR